MNYKAIREEIETTLNKNAHAQGIVLKSYPPQKAFKLPPGELPVMTVMIKQADHTDREGRASLQKVILIQIIVIEKDGIHEETYLPFLESVFQKSYFPLKVESSVSSDLRYTGFQVSHKNEGEYVLSFLTFNLELNLEEALEEVIKE